MGTAPQFPVFIKTVYDPGNSKSEFIADVADMMAAADRKVSQFSSRAKSTLDDALRMPRTATGGLDLGVGNAQAAAQAAQVRATAAREVANALARTAAEERDNSLAMKQSVLAAHELASAEERNAATLQAHARISEQVQARLNAQASAVEHVTGALGRNKAANDNIAGAMGRQRAAFVNFGQQLQDVTVQLQGGTTGGNNADLKASATQSGNSINSALASIAERLGASLGNYSVAIGQRKDEYRVSASGSTGNTTAKKTGSDIIYKGKDAEAAARAALQNAIQDGAIQGISASAQRLLQKYASAVDKAVSKVLAFEGVARDLKALKDPVGAALDDLNKQFANLKSTFEEAGASAAEYAQLEELYGLKRKDVLQQVRVVCVRSQLSAVFLRKELTMSESSISARLAEIRANAGLVKVGGVVMTKAEADRPGHASTKAAPKSLAAQPKFAAPISANAVANAVAAERKRVAAVFANSASIGRERAAADFLASDESAANIVAALADLPTDAERAHAAKVKQSEASSATWGRVIADMNARWGFGS